MKNIAKWYKWILLAVIFQFGVLLYMNNVFLSTNVDVSVSENSAVKQKPSTGEFKVPEGAQMISLSFNAKFGAYLDDGELHIIDVDKGKSKTVAGTGKDKITYFRWLPDRDMVIYSSDTKNGQNGTVQVSTYEADSETSRDYPELSGLPAKSQVKDIELSPYTNMVYAKVQTSDTRARIIRFNVMGQYARVMTVDSSIVIKECTYTNKLVYQEKGKQINIYDGIKKANSRVPIDVNNVTVLGIDLNDTLYIGELDNNGMVTQIYSQKIEDNSELTDNWTKMSMKETASPENIVVTGNGNLYINNKNENRVKNLKNDLKASYRGEFIEILEGVLVSKDENKVNITSLKEY
ncbi:hypothetical protein [Ruminiclostridium papyrosolvens]|uniref:Dipeptidyl peptidase IV n=1 Tax=Ruminiclostridium papyrosolvens C7 TaxID=1330534 RepID=U4R1N5_9FIRM|nr:hypothetical protein [Ruminiclostridium papyrosolvens]EPR11960.1 hypothetical protein L323_10020 [Ruminiclostridium papyrosolvens C7]